MASNTPGLSVGTKAGIALGSIAVAALIGALVLWLLIKAGALGKRTKATKSSPVVHDDYAYPLPTHVSEMQDSQVKLSELDGNPQFEMVGGSVRI